MKLTTIFKAYKKAKYKLDRLYLTSVTDAEQYNRKVAQVDCFESKIMVNLDILDEDTEIRKSQDKARTELKEIDKEYSQCSWVNGGPAAEYHNHGSMVEG